jgi:hypothetical protein
MDSITGIPGPFAAVRQPICRMARKHDAETVPGALWDAVGLCRGDCAASPCPRLPQSAVTSGTCFPLLKVCRPNLPGRSADRSDPRHGIPSSAPEKAARGLCFPVPGGARWSSARERCRATWSGAWRAEPPATGADPMRADEDEQGQHSGRRHLPQSCGVVPRQVVENGDGYEGGPPGGDNGAEPPQRGDGARESPGNWIDPQGSGLHLVAQPWIEVPSRFVGQSRAWLLARPCPAR